MKKHKNGAEELKDLIQEVLHHPDFNPHDIDHDMHQQVMDCIAQGNLELIDLWEEGDGAQEVMLYKRSVLKVLSKSSLQTSAWQGASTLRLCCTTTRMVNAFWHHGRTEKPPFNTGALYIP